MQEQMTKFQDMLASNANTKHFLTLRENREGLRGTERIPTKVERILIGKLWKKIWTTFGQKVKRDAKRQQIITVRGHHLGSNQ
jgi:hypothetical protein